MRNYVKKVLMIITISILLTGCSQIYNHFQDRLDKINGYIQESEWNEASKELKQMKQSYEKTYEWRDFYINREDSVTLIEIMGEIDGAIQVEDKKQAKMIIAKFEAFLKEIYYEG